MSISKNFRSAVRRATALSMIYNIIEVISIHALREESDSIPALHFSSFQRFQSTLSVRRATVCKIFVRSFIIHFNPRSPWGERLYGCNRPFHKLIISIHALREESDIGKSLCSKSWNNFNPRSPWGERPRVSTSSVAISMHFNPRSPWGERPYASALNKLLADISIHALREESDPEICFAWDNYYAISIHALREESDSHSLHNM